MLDKKRKLVRRVLQTFAKDYMDAKLKVYRESSDRAAYGFIETMLKKECPCMRSELRKDFREYYDTAKRTDEWRNEEAKR